MQISREAEQNWAKQVVEKQLVEKSGEKTMRIHSGKVIKQNKKHECENSIAYNRNPHQYVHNMVKYKNRRKCAKEIKDSIAMPIKQY